MKGDFSRLTFDPKKHYSGVRMQQGRVQLDADWNEQVDITEHRIETLFTDLIGDSGAPRDHFRISVGKNDENDRDITIGEGRIYVAGLLCENGKTCSITEQPYLPKAERSYEDGDYLCYLDVWQRLVTVLEDPNLREPALGGPDTAARVQNVWQVKLKKVEGNNPDSWKDTLSELKRNAISTGTMEAEWDTQSTPPENQLYRVEIHKGGGPGTATFKWSRDNGAIAARVDSITSNNTQGHTIVLSQEGPATLSWFSPDEYIEFSNEALTLNREPGILAKLARVDGLTLTTKNGSVVLPEKLGENPIVRRWDSRGAVPVKAADNDGWIPLEHGIRVKFEKGNYKTGDYWLIPARRNDPRGIMFPKEAQPSKGVRHYYAPLALLERSKKKWQLIKDELVVFSPLTTGLVSKAGDTMTGTLKIDNGNFESIIASGTITAQKFDGDASNLKVANVTLAALREAMDILVPIGTILPYGGTREPAGWLFCDGRVLKREEYQELYTVIGNNFGARNENQFNVPDLRGRFVRGVDNKQGRDPNAQDRGVVNLGGNQGDKVGSVQEDEVGSHRHMVYSTNCKLGEKYYACPTPGKQGGSEPGANHARHTANLGEGIGKETRPKNIYVNWIIKAKHVL